MYVYIRTYIHTPKYIHTSVHKYANVWASVPNPLALDATAHTKALSRTRPGAR